MTVFLKYAASFFTWLRTLIWGAPAPTKTDLTAGKAVAETELIQEEKSHAETTEAAQARTDADTRIVLNSPEANTVNTDPKAAINTDPNAHYRD